jgi:biotin carboxylase
MKSNSSEIHLIASMANITRRALIKRTATAAAILPLASFAARSASAAEQAAQFGALFHTNDFIEGRKAEAEGRKPLYRGN